jgi:dihydroorotate dehydrogenase electron transfer subunit
MNLPAILTKAQIVENKEIIPQIYLMKLYSPELASRVIAGQFFHIKVADRTDLLLRRPLSVFNYSKDNVSMLYEVVGKGTAVLAEKRPGIELDILGPLGNGFSITPDVKQVILVSGGIGVAPIFCWAKELVDKKRQGTDIDIKVLIGAKNRYRVLCEEDFKGLGLVPEIATDDGSAGHNGFVTDLLKSDHCLPSTIDHRPSTVVYACGPNAMLKETAKALSDHKINGYVSMDRWMGCGMGVCLGCVVKTTDGKYKRACKDGPVFRADEIEWI